MWLSFGKWMIVVLLICSSTDVYAARVYKLDEHFAKRLEQQLQGKIITSNPVDRARTNCRMITTILQMGGKPYPIEKEQCQLSDGSWRTGMDYDVQLLTKQGKMIILRVNPDIGEITQLR